MSKKKKHNDTIPEDDCECEDCVMRGDAYYHLHDAVDGLVLLYSDRYEAEPSVVGIAVLQALMDILADMIVTPAMGLPEEKKLIAEMVDMFRNRMEEVRQARTEEITEAAAAAQAELN
jgi:hypothetical protein